MFGYILRVPCFLLVSLLQEAYSVARQFNMIPPVCEQAEYHLFQREKVEVQLPELYHKIGKVWGRALHLSHFEREIKKGRSRGSRGEHSPAAGGKREPGASLTA